MITFLCIHILCVCVSVACLPCSSGMFSCCSGKFSCCSGIFLTNVSGKSTRLVVGRFDFGLARAVCGDTPSVPAVAFTLFLEHGAACCGLQVDCK